MNLRSYREPGALKQKEIVMTQISLKTPAVPISHDWMETHSLAARNAALSAWQQLPEQVRKTCKQIIVAYRGVTLQKSDCWTFHFIFQLEKSFPEFPVMYTTANMGVPKDSYVLKTFTSEELADILVNGQPHMVTRERKPGLLEAFQVEVKRQRSLLDAKMQMLARFAPALEVREVNVKIAGSNIELALARPAIEDITPDQFIELTLERGFQTFNGLEAIHALNSVLDKGIEGVTDLATISRDQKYGYLMNVSFHEEDRSRENVWVKRTDVWQQAMENRAWFVVRR